MHVSLLNFFMSLILQPLRSLFSRLMLCLLLISSMSNVLWGALEVNVTQGMFAAHPLIVLGPPSPEFQELSAVIKKNLSTSGVFKIMYAGTTSSGYSFDKAGLSDQYNLSRAHLSLFIDVQTKNGRCIVKCRLFDLLQLREVYAFTLQSGVSNLRRLAHRISDKVYQYATGMPGYFETQIIYVAGMGAGKKRHFRLALMDSDGYNHRYLRTFYSLLKMPYYDIKNKRILYIRNRIRNKPQVCELDLYWNKETPLNIAPESIFSFRPIEDTRFLAVTLYHCPRISRGIGYSSVGLYNLSTGSFRKIVRDQPYIFVSPTASAEKQMLVFNSDHEGYPQLYKTILSGGGFLERISQQSGRYYSPVFSKKSKKIAFMKRDSSGFNIGIMNADGSNERTLANFYWAESPYWTPSGSALLFLASYTPRQKAQIYRLDINSLKIIKLTTNNEAFDPSCCALN